MPAPLDYETEKIKEMLTLVMNECLNHIQSLPSQACCGDINNDQCTLFCESLEEPLPEGPSQLSDLLSLIFNQCVPLSLNTASGGYFAYIPGGGVLPAMLADMITNSVNRFCGVRAVAPALVRLESISLDWLRDWVKFPKSTKGMYTSGGSLSIFNAILCAREKYLTGDTLRSGVIYVNDQNHFASIKGAKLAGIMHDRVRVLVSDSNHCMPIESLSEAIATDRQQGLIPFMVISNAGTTNSGVVDPLNAIADVCQMENIWHHIDGAYGGFFYCLKEFEHGVLAGLNRADSITLDPHKGLCLSYGTGALLVRNGQDLKSVHSCAADCLPSSDHLTSSEYDPVAYSPELSRGNPGLRMWLTLKLFGSQMYVDHFILKRRLALLAHDRLAALNGVAIITTPDLSLFAFHISWNGASLKEENAQTTRLVDRVIQKGRVSLSGAWLKDRYVARVCVLSFRSEESHIDMLVCDVREAVIALLPSALLYSAPVLDLSPPPSKN